MHGGDSDLQPVPSTQQTANENGDLEVGNGERMPVVPFLLSPCPSRTHFLGFGSIIIFEPGIQTDILRGVDSSKSLTLPTDPRPPDHPSVPLSSHTAQVQPQSASSSTHGFLCT